VAWGIKRFERNPQYPSVHSTFKGSTKERWSVHQNVVRLICNILLYILYIFQFGCYYNLVQYTHLIQFNVKTETNWPIRVQCLESHAQLSINYYGSAPGMECTGAKRIFQRSIQKHGLRYTSLLGDGDSKSFTSVKESMKVLLYKS
jgi:hypothetical protein